VFLQSLSSNWREQCPESDTLSFSGLLKVLAIDEDDVASALSQSRPLRPRKELLRLGRSLSAESKSVKSPRRSPEQLHNCGVARFPHPDNSSIPVRSPCGDTVSPDRQSSPQVRSRYLEKAGVYAIAGFGDLHAGMVPRGQSLFVKCRAETRRGKDCQGKPGKGQERHSSAERSGAMPRNRPSPCQKQNPVGCFGQRGRDCRRRLSIWNRQEW